MIIKATFTHEKCWCKPTHAQVLNCTQRLLFHNTIFSVKPNEQMNKKIHFSLEFMCSQHYVQSVKFVNIVVARLWKVSQRKTEPTKRV